MFHLFAAVLILSTLSQSSSADLTKCANITHIGSLIIDSSTCVGHFATILTVTNQDDYCIASTNGLRCAAAIAVPGDVDGCMKLIKQVVDSDPLAIINYALSQITIPNFVLPPTIEAFASASNSCVILTSNNATICHNDAPCTIGTTSMYCNQNRSICMQGTAGSVVNCTRDFDCNYSLQKCLTDPLDNTTKICTPVVEECSNTCSGGNLTSCVPKANHNFKGIVSAVCLPIDCTMDNTCTNTMQNTVCSENVCKCLPSYFLINQTCSQDFLTFVNTEASLVYTNNEPVIQIGCLFDPMLADFIYEVKWLLGNGGMTLKTLEATSSTPTNAILMTDSDVASFLLNDMIYCSLRVLDPYRVALASTRNSAGLQLLQIDSTTVSLNRGAMFEFCVTMNFAYGCSVNENCVLEILLFDTSDSYDCTATSVAMFGNNTCGCKTTPKSATDVTNAGGRLVQSPEQFKCYMTTKNDFYTGYTSPKTMTLRTSFTGRSSATPTLEGILSQQVTVTLTQQYSGIPTCILFSTGFVLTFDKRSVSLRNAGSGMLTVYKHTQKNTEIQVKTAISQSTGKPEIKGIYVKAGQDIFVVYHTTSSHQNSYVQQQTSSTNLIQVYKLSNVDFAIRLPFGTEVMVHIHLGYGISLTVVVVSSPSDYNNVKGICGNFNGNDADDLQDPSGTAVTTDVALATAWQPGTADRLDVITNFPNQAAWPSTDQKCICHTSNTLADLVCAYQDDLSCKNGAITPQYGTVFTSTSSSRRRREVQYDHFMYTPDVVAVDEVGKRVDDEMENVHHHISKREATMYCNALDTSCPLILNTDIIQTTERQKIVDYCIEDYGLNSSVNWQQVYCTPIEILALTYFYRDSTFQSNNPGTVNTVCTGGCSNGGTCTNGQCSCASGYGGTSCTLVTSDKILIYSDLQVSTNTNTPFTCQTITTSGAADSITCRIVVYVAVSSDSTIIFQESYTVDVSGTIIDQFNVNCCLPTRRRRRRSTSQQNNHYSITTSNDGMTYSDPITVTTLDSTCQNITTNQDGNTYITLLSGYCFISGQCYNDSDVNPSSSCQYCTTTYNLFNWNDTCVYNVNTDSDEGLPAYGIALIIVAVIGVIGGAIVAVYFLKKKTRRSVSDIFTSRVLREKTRGSLSTRENKEVQGVGESKSERPAYMKRSVSDVFTSRVLREKTTLSTRENTVVVGIGGSKSENPAYM